MDGAYGHHVANLLADAASEFANGRLDLARQLAEAALILEPDNLEGRRLLRRVDGTGASPGERRQLTVMFCDVVGSTELSSQVDPEVMRELLRAYQGACGDVVGRFDGHIALYVGDGTIAYFGYPRAHEDDPRRGVEAGLEVLEALRPIASAARTRHGVELAVRIGVHTGFVVRAEMGGPERRDRDAIVGEAPNLVSRLQERAKPDTVIISGATEELTRGYFVTRAMGPQTLRGIAEPVDAFEVVAAVDRAGRLDTQAALTRFVGRDVELDQLWEMWRGVVDGASSVTLLRGDPGIGKSRLAAVHRQRVADDSGSTLTCSCSSFHTSTHLYPVRRLVEQACGIVTRDDPRAAVALLRTALADLGREDLLGAFADLLGVPPEPAWSTPELDGPQLRELTFVGLVEWVSAAATQTPLLLVIDDLQWADPSTLELIGRVAARRIPGLQFVLTARNDFAPPWGAQTTTIDLKGLDVVDLRLLAASIPAGAGLDDDRVDQLVARSDGVPLYMEELVRSAGSQRNDVDVAATTGVPRTLVDALLARLASPRVDLTLAQMIATIGHEADREVLAMVTGLDEATLTSRLSALMDVHLIEIGGGEYPIFRFRHQLMAELAYDTQLIPIRRRRHSAVADVLASIDIHGVPADAGQIGYHLERAERFGEAIDAYVRAARNSLAHGAAEEAERQLDYAIGVLDDVGDEKERAGLELVVRQARGLAAVSMYGYTSLQAESDFRRCLELCEELGRAPDHLPSLTGVWQFYLFRGNLDRADEILVVDRRRLGLEPDDAIPVVAGTGGIQFFRGDFRRALADMEAFLASPYAQGLDGTPADWPLPDDPIVNVTSFVGLTRWIMGDPARAMAALDEAEAIADRLVFPHRAFGAGFAKMLRIVTLRLANDDETATAVIEDLEAIAERHGFLFFALVAAGQRMFGDLRRGGSVDEALAVVATWQATGGGSWNPWAMCEAAAACARAGDATAAERLILAAEEEADRTGCHFYDAEILRVRGELALGTGDLGGVGILDQAADLAHGQGARVFELRARLARCRLADDPGARERLGSTLDSMPAAAGIREYVDARGLLSG